MQSSQRSPPVAVLVATLILLGSLAIRKGVAQMTLTLSSESFTAGGEIPTEHSCEGADLSPHLSWSGAPDGSRSFALIVDDPDAPDPAAPKMTWVHWVVYNLPADSSELAAGIAPVDLPMGTQVGRNDWRRQSYGGPCPPIGRHRYFHKLYALDTVLPDDTAADKKWLEAAMEGHILASAELVGTYEKKH